MRLGFRSEPRLLFPHGARTYDLPIRQAWLQLNNCREQWGSQNAVHAYICCCFAELAYLHLTDRELDQAGRYKAVPSLAHQALARDGLTFDVRTTGESLDFPSFVFETERFVYAGFEVRDLALVAIRGTVGWADWAINLQGLLRWDQRSEGKLHAGFLGEALAAEPLLHEHLQVFRRATRVLFTGHSLGGAVASTLHARWIRNSDACCSMTPYVFGAPRYGDAAIRERAGVFAYAKPFDLVPHVPPRLLGYADTGAPALVVAEGHTPVMPSGLAVANAWLPRPGGPAFARQHAIELYRRRLGMDIAPMFPDLVYWEFAEALMASRPAREFEAPPGY